MRLVFSLLALVLFGAGCNEKKIPDVSNVQVEITTQRFERDLFTADTIQMAASITKLIKKYPVFSETFLRTIINVDPAWRPDSIANYLKNFMSAYKKVYDSSEVVFAEFNPYEKDIQKGLQYVKHYFPSYKLPTKIITYIGPLDGFGDILDEGSLYIGLHQHLGKNFSLYTSAWVQETYPEYISNRFEPSYIAVNALKNIASDLYPEKNEDKSLVIQMVEKGKQLYLLQQFLPKIDEYKLIGYRASQLKDCYDHEAAIWNLFVQNNFLQTIDYNVIKNYVGEGPKTQELGDASPGNIGSFSGWQIVKKYMSENEETPLKSLMEMDAEKLFAAARYKP